MKEEIKVPAMGESITEATVGEILKPSGSAVKEDDEVLELETDKVNQVLFAPKAGVVTISVKTDEVVKIGQVIGFVETDGAAAPEPKKEEKAPEPEPVKEPVKEPVADSIRESKEEYLTGIFAKEKAPVPAPGKPSGERGETRKRMTKIRKVIAKRLVEAQQTTAMLTTFNEVDLTKVIELRKKYKDIFLKEHEVKLGFMSFFVKATVSALMEYPEVNSYIDGEEIVHRDYYDVGIAVGTERGLVVPVVRDCNQLSFPQIEGAIETYAKQARDGTLTADALQGGGFTITNGGVYGSLLSTPILNPPQSAILGMHKIEKRPVVVDDQIVIRPMMYLAMSYDHRVLDGKGAVTFLVHVKNCLEDPSRLLLEV